MSGDAAPAARRSSGWAEAASDVDVDVVEAWAASGGEWLTAPTVPVPAGLVRAVVGLVSFLDERGAGLAEITSAAGLGLLAERAASIGLQPSSATSCGGAGRLLRTGDDWIVVSLARDDDIAMIPAWLGVDADPGRHWDVVESAVVALQSSDVVAQARLLGIPCGRVGEVDAGDPVRREQLGAAAGLPLRDVTVVNLGSLWAAPLCADVLARLGARVITVESTARPDGARRTSGFFEALHGRSESVALDLRSGDGRRRLAELLHRVDVVIEGSRPRALEQMGIDARALVAAGPQIWLSITGYGRSGSAANWVGFGDDAAAAGGLVGNVDGAPVFIADAVADPLSGLMAAAEIVELLESGGRHLVDVGLARAAASVRRGEMPPPSATPRPPSVRRDAGAPMPFGSDTDRILAEFSIS